MKYKALFIDIDDTLLDYDSCCREAFDFGMRAIDKTPTDELYELFFDIADRLFEEAKQGKHTIAEVMELYPAEYIERAEIDGRLLEPFKHGFREGWGQTHAKVAGAEEMIRALHGNYRLFAASNSFAHLQRQRLQLAGLLDMFEDTYISSDIGYDKPDVRFYEEALGRCGCEAKEVLMIGDSVTTDVIGAQAAGLDTCWFNPNKKIRPDAHPTYMISELSELTALLVIS